MNRYFIRGEGRREYPRHSHARIDQIEPPDPEAEGDVVIAFDAVDAEWKGLREDSLFSLETDDDGERVKNYWNARFGGRDPDDITWQDPFDDLPLFRIELTLERDHPWTWMLLDPKQDWFDIELSEEGEVEADVFGGLFMPPVTAMMTHAPSPSPQAEALSRKFSMATWPDATPDELDRALGQQCPLNQLLVLDIGQGSACALICNCGAAHYYFDVGCGVYRNMKTNPPLIRFCECAVPPVILSHWDSDHWAGATLDTAMLKRTWVAPRQKVGPKHLTFGNGILKAGGNILVFPRALSPFAFGTTQTLTILACNGSDRNNSGLALTVEDSKSGRAWLLTGDARYDKIPQPLPPDLAAVVVPHHGADMGHLSVPPGPGAHHYSRLLYSFGPGNAHGKTSVSHPTQAAVTAHATAGWSHGAWVTSTPGHTKPGTPVLATATHQTTHDEGALAGWTCPPAIHLHLTSCPKAMPVSQV